MGMGLGGRGFIGNTDLADKGVREEAEGKHCGVCCREADIQTFYKVRDYGGLWEVPKMAEPITRPHTGGVEGTVKDKI